MWPLFTRCSDCWFARNFVCVELSNIGEGGEKKQLFCCKFTLWLLQLLGGAVMVKSDIFSHLPTKNVGFIFQMKFALLRCQQGFFE